MKDWKNNVQAAIIIHGMAADALLTLEMTGLEQQEELYTAKRAIQAVATQFDAEEAAQQALTVLEQAEQAVREDATAPHEVASYRSQAPNMGIVLAQLAIAMPYLETVQAKQDCSQMAMSLGDCTEVLLEAARA